MATRDFLVNIDLKQNKLINAVLETSREHPVNPVQGQIYFNTVDEDVKVFTGKTWISLNNIQQISNGK